MEAKKYSNVFSAEHAPPIARLQDTATVTAQEL
jgi:hypothetical protein